MTVSLPTPLLSVLESLGYLSSDSLLTVSSENTNGPRDYYWQELHRKVGLDAAFFLEGVPMVGFSGLADNSRLKQLRGRLWNYGRVPLLINANENEVTAYSATSSKIQRVDEPPAEIIQSERTAAVANGLMQAFHRQQVESGRFDAASSFQYNRSGRVDSALLRNLSFLRTRAGKDAARAVALDTAIGGAITASYLHDRGILSEDHMIDLAGSPNLDTALSGGPRRVLRLFENLAERFNGDVFGAMPAALAALEETDLLGVRSLLRGDELETGQHSLWPYDFSVLPADLVSNIYERFLVNTQRSAGAYYTPRFLVDLVLDELLPWDMPVLPRVVDIACGSGAFITEAYRRLIYQQKMRQKWSLNYQQLLTILQKSIYGVDQSSSAARVATFGLYLSLLEELPGPTVWDQVRLPNLIGANLVVADAFDAHALADEKFDVVVSNPPWRSSLTAPATKFIERTNLPVADQQIAHSFLWLARNMLTPKGQIGMVMPAKGLLYNSSANARRVRNAIFEHFDVHGIVDLSAMRGSDRPFSAATMPAAVLIARLPSHDSAEESHGASQRNDYITHVAPHPRARKTPVDAIIITPEEVRSVSRMQAATRTEIWKVMLWGSHRDLQLIDRVRASFPTVDELARSRNWRASRGYQIDGGDHNDTSAIIGLPIAPTESIRPLHLDPESLSIFRNGYAHRPRDRNLYKSPLVLIRRGVDNHRLAAVLSDVDTAFPDGVIGISGGPKDRSILITLAAVISSSFGNYWHFMTSSSWGVDRGYVEKNEHLSMPLPQPTIEQAAKLELITAQVAGSGQEKLPGELNEIVFDLYQLSSSERDHVRDRIRTSIGRFYERSNQDEPVSMEALGRYAETIQKTLSITLDGIEISIQMASQALYRAVAVSLRDPSVPYSTTAEVTVDIDHLLRTSIQPASQLTGLVPQPSGFFVDEDTVYIVKTADKDRWTLDAALDDADRIVGALIAG